MSIKKEYVDKEKENHPKTDEGELKEISWWGWIKLLFPYVHLYNLTAKWAKHYLSIHFNFYIIVMQQKLMFL